MHDSIFEDRSNFLNNFKLFPVTYVLPLNFTSRFLVSLPNPENKMAQHLRTLCFVLILLKQKIPFALYISHPHLTQKKSPLTGF